MILARSCISEVYWKGREGGGVFFFGLSRNLARRLTVALTWASRAGFACNCNCAVPELL